MSQRSPLIYKGLRPLAVAGFGSIMRPKIIGRENIPKDGRVVIAGNHTKPFDVFMLFLSTRRCLHFLAKAELFKGPLDKFFKAAGIIPVDRSRKNPEALNAARDYLNNESAVAIFPEGTTNKTDAVLLPFRMGAVKMARDTSSPIVPFTISGKYKLTGPRPEIRFYPPFYVGDGDLEQENEKFRQFIYDNLVNKEKIS
jgi:1-acyl-sn-glycerol-3-phosphate acyltransferase